MQNQGLLFIPDISGFTRFINETEIEHSRLIIQELLEGLINANEIGLEVSEIEGDAILFYKFGQPPSIDTLYKQVEKMFCDFHKNLIAYDARKYCQCKACLSAAELTLKIITHYGEFTGYNVKTFNKLIGKDVIVAHQLLKNDIVHHEYWLVTKNLLKGETPPAPAEEIQWKTSTKQTDSGEIDFLYAQLGDLKQKLIRQPAPEFDLSNKVCLISLTKEYDVDAIKLFHATGDFNLRNQWMEGIIAVKNITHVLPRVGMSCVFITDKGDVTVYSSGYSYSENLIEFSETNTQTKATYYFRMEVLSPTRTRLTIQYYMPQNWLRNISFNWREKSSAEAMLTGSMDKLGPVAQKIELPE